MKWGQAIRKYALYKAAKTTKNREEIERQTIFVINNLLNQMPKLVDKKIDEIKKIPEVWYASIQDFRKSNKDHIKWKWNDLTKWQKYKELRRCLVLALNNYSCEYCGRSSERLDLQVDHRVPSSGGGNEELTNLACSCSFCNLGKRTMGEKEFKRELLEVAKSVKNKYWNEF